MTTLPTGRTSSRAIRIDANTLTIRRYQIIIHARENRRTVGEHGEKKTEDNSLIKEMLTR